MIATNDSAISLKDFRESVHRALRGWHDDRSDDIPLASLTLFQETRRHNPGTVRQVANRLLEEAIHSLSTDHEPDARLLRRRFVDRTEVFTIAREMGMAETTVYQRQRTAIDRLAAIILAR